jgi:integrase
MGATSENSAQTTEQQEEQVVYRYSRTANQCSNDESRLGCLASNAAACTRMANDRRGSECSATAGREEQKNREFVLNDAQEKIYLEFAPVLLHELDMMIDTGLDSGEALGLEKKDINFKATTDSPFGFLQVREGKTVYRPRSVSLTGRVQSMLRDRWPKSGKQLCIRPE